MSAEAQWAQAAAAAFVEPAPVAPAPRAGAIAHDPAAPALLSSYRPQDSLLSSTRAQLHARGVLQALARAATTISPAPASACWRRSRPKTAAAAAGRGAVRRRPAGAAAGAGAGRVRRRPRAPSRRRARRPRRSAPRRAGRAGAGAGAVQAQRRTPLERIHDGGLRKVVMSRSLRIAARVDVPQLLGQLLARAPSAYTFAMSPARARYSRPTGCGRRPRPWRR